MTGRIKITSAVAFCFTVARAACAEAPPPAARPDNLLLIVVDTLRADHLGLYGYDRPTTPGLDRLAREAIIFERARSQAACTFPSMNSLLTSRVAGSFLGQGYGNFTIPESMPTLATILKSRGFTTFAASASVVVRATPSRINRRGGYGRGFMRFDESCLDRPASCLNVRLGEFLDHVPGRFFAYLHYMDPHHPYAPPAAHPRRLTRAHDAAAWASAGNPDPIGKRIRKGQSLQASPADLAMLRDLYDEEIAYLDTQMVALFDDLRVRGLLERTVVVLAADHGEMFLEHGDIKHCRGVWDTVTRTPLLMWIPAVSGRRIPTPVENLDILPTVIDALGVDRGQLDLHGRSLRPEIEGARISAPRFAFSAQRDLRSVDDGRFKLIVDLETGKRRLYDLESDPGERVDLLAQEPAIVARLARALEARLALHGRGDRKRLLHAGREVEHSLRALGYLE